MQLAVSSVVLVLCIVFGGVVEKLTRDETPLARNFWVGLFVALGVVAAIIFVWSVWLSFRKVEEPHQKADK